MFKKKKVRRKHIMASLQKDDVSKAIYNIGKKVGCNLAEEVLQMKRDSAYAHLDVDDELTIQEKHIETHPKKHAEKYTEEHEKHAEEHVEKHLDEISIRQERIRVADPLLMQLEDEVISFINRRLEEHVAKRIKGILLPTAKLSLKMQRLQAKFSDKREGYFSDLLDDLDYILESSKLRRISPVAGEKFNPLLHEEVDFTWDPNRQEAEILATYRDGFFWEYNQEMILKPQVVVNRRISA